VRSRPDAGHRADGLPMEDAVTIAFDATIPILRIFDIAKAREF